MGRGRTALTCDCCAAAHFMAYARSRRSIRRTCRRVGGAPAGGGRKAGLGHALPTKPPPTAVVPEYLLGNARKLSAGITCLTIEAGLPTSIAAMVLLGSFVRRDESDVAASFAPTVRTSSCT